MARHFNEVEVFDLPPEFRPIGAWGYFGYTLLFSLPVIGLIFLIVFSFSDANINRRNYARSYFIALLFAVILIAVGVLTGTLNTVSTAVSNGSITLPTL